MKYITLGNVSINPDLVLHFTYQEPQPAPSAEKQDETLRQDARPSRLTVCFVGGSEMEFQGDDANSTKARLLVL